MTEAKRGRGRPSTGTRVDVRLPDDLLEAVDQAAVADNVGRAEMIRRLIARALGR